MNPSCDFSKFQNKDDAPPEFSIVIPARNEEAFLPSCLKAIEASAKYAKASLEVIVVVNRCTDSTEEIARSASCRVVETDAKNLAKIRNLGAASARGEILITVDADSCVSKNMLTEIRKALRAGDCIGGATRLFPTRYSLGIILTTLCLVPICLWYGISGGLFFCRRETFEKIGGFDESFHSVEDIDFAVRLKHFGKQIGQRFKILWKTEIITSTRKFDKLGDWYFLKRPLMFLRVLRNADRQASNLIWYDFEKD